MSSTNADYVIIGAGSAGCAMAYRLSEAGHSVLVIEHGGSDAGPLIQMPAALSYPMNMPRYDWGYRTEPEPHLGGRQLAAPRGKVIGGSSSINAMVYVRGNASDYDHWATVWHSLCVVRSDMISLSSTLVIAKLRGRHIRYPLEQPIERADVRDTDTVRNLDDSQIGAAQQILSCFDA